MIIKYLIDKLEDKRHMIVEKKHCIHYRNKFNRCRLCEKMCKSKAISIGDKEVQIDKDRCILCGKCSVLCPSNAIRLEGFDNLSFISKVKDKYIISCNNYDNSTLQIKTSCLCGLSSEYISIILITLRKKSIYFDLSNCKDCKIKLNCSEFEKSLNMSLDLLKDLEIETSVEMIFDKGNMDKVVNKEITRKEFFNFIKNETTDVSKDLVKEFINNTFKINKSHDFNERKFLLDCIKDLKINDKKLKTTIFTSWNVNSNCNGCGLCEAICPWSAWNILNLQNERIIKHNLKMCRSCGLCKDLCKNNAIYKGEVYSNYFEKEFIDKIILKK